MTRKDYVLIAEAIKRALAVDAETISVNANTAVAAILEGLAEDLAGELKAANNSFNVTKFLRACGVTP